MRVNTGANSSETSWLAAVPENNQAALLKDAPRVGSLKPNSRRVKRGFSVALLRSTDKFAQRPDHFVAMRRGQLGINRDADHFLRQPRGDRTGVLRITIRKAFLRV